MVKLVIFLNTDSDTGVGEDLFLLVPKALAEVVVVDRRLQPVDGMR